MTKPDDYKESQPISVLIVEDHEIMRFGLRKSLQKFQQIDVVGEASSGLEAVRFNRELRPDVIVMDIGLPELNGIDATRMVKEESPNTKVVILSSFDDAQRTCASLAAGADAYCVKNVKADQLVKVIGLVFQGSSWLDPQVARHVVKVYTVDSGTGKNDDEKTVAVSDEEDEKLGSLTRRELEVLRLLVDGKAEVDIAMRLGVNENTVRGYIRKILNKLSVDEKTQVYLAHLQPGRA